MGIRVHLSAISADRMRLLFTQKGMPELLPTNGDADDAVKASDDDSVDVSDVSLVDDLLKAVR